MQEFKGTDGVILVLKSGRHRFTVRRVVQEDGEQIVDTEMTFYRVPRRMKVDGMVLGEGDWIPLARRTPNSHTVGIEVVGSVPMLVNGDNNEKHINTANVWLAEIRKQLRIK